MPARQPLNYRQVIRILKNLGFAGARHKATSHETWRLFRQGRWHTVTVYFHGKNYQFPPKTLRSMIEQSGFSEEEFHRVLKKK